MTWLQLSFKEWQRRPLRTGIAAGGVAIAIAALFSLLAFQRGYQDGVRLELDRLGAHVLLAPKGCPYDAASMALHGANWPCYLKQEYLAEVRAVRGVATAAPVVMAAVYDSDSTQTVYEGVETNLLALKPSWRIQGAFPEQENTLLVGSDIAKRRGWHIGQNVPLPGLPGQAATVTGILRPTGGADDTFVFLRLADAQRLFRVPNQLTHVLVRLADPNQLDGVVAELRGCDAGLAMNVVPLAHMFRTIQSLVNSTRLLLGCVALLALLVAGAGVSNTILMAVAERRREIGIMRAIGASRANIFRLVWLETSQVCLSGALAGVFLAFIASRGAEAWVRGRLPFGPTDPLIHWDSWIAAACLACALLLGCLAGFLPAWQAASVPPMTAIRDAGGRG